MPRLTIVFLLGSSLVLVSMACGQEIQEPMLEQLKQAAESQIGSIDLNGRVMSSEGQPLQEVAVDYYFRNIGDVLADAEIENKRLVADGDFRIKKRNISSINVWISKKGYYTEQWSFGFGGDIPRRNPDGYERIDVDFVLERQPRPAPLKKFYGFLRSDLQGPVSVVEVRREGPGETWLWENGEKRELEWPYVFLVADDEDDPGLPVMEFKAKNSRRTEKGLKKGWITFAEPEPGDGFIVFDPGEVPARPETAMRTMYKAPDSGYELDLTLSVADSPPKVYFYCKVNGHYGKGMVSGRPLIDVEDDRQVARAAILIYLNPTGSRDVSYVHR